MVASLHVEDRRGGEKLGCGWRGWEEGHPTKGTDEKSDGSWCSFLAHSLIAL
jgi:hypothetical protein